MKINIHDIIDFKLINNLLQGFNNTTGHITAMLDLKGNLLSNSALTKKETDFYRINFENSKKCSVSDIGFAEEFTQSEKYQCYAGLNGLIEVSVPIEIKGEHIANLFSGQFFFEKPDLLVFKNQAQKYGLNEDDYLKELEITPIISKEKVELNLAFLFNLAEMISELSCHKLKQVELKSALTETEDINLKRKKRLDYALESIDTGVWELDLVSGNAWRSFKHDHIFGYLKPFENWTYKTFLEHVITEDRTLVDEKFQEAIAAKSDWNFECRIIRKDGVVRWIQGKGNHLLNIENEATLMFGVVQDITNRKLTEIKIKESEEKFRTFSNISPVGVFVTDADGQTTYYNDKTTEIIGLPIEEGKGIGWTKNIHPDDREKVLCEWNKTIASKAKFDLTYRFKNKQGKITWVIAQAVPMLNILGELIGFVGSLFDITKQKHVENELSDSFKREKNLGDIVRNAPIAIAYGYPDGRLDNCNDAFLKLVGYTEEELKKINWNEQLTPSHWINIESEALQKLTSKNKAVQYEKEYIHKNGTIIPIELYVIGKFNKNNELINFVGFVIDITERKQNLKNLEERNEYIESILGNMPIGFAVNTIDDGDVKYMNKSFEDIYGWSKDVLTNTNLFFEKVFPNKEYQEKMSKQIIADMQSGDPSRMYWDNLKIVTSTGEERFVKAINIPLVNQGLMISTVQDTSEQKRIQEQLISSKVKAEESDRLKSAFLANMSHEIRTPMNGILGFSSLLKDPDLTSKNQQKYIEIIERSGARMLNIIQEIIDISRIESGAMEVIVKDVNINEEVENVYNLLKLDAEQKGLHFSVKNGLANEQVKIKTDGYKLEGILTNLIKNAIKYTDIGAIEVGYQLKGNFLEFYVKDTGIGVAKDRREAIFERFIQADITDVEARQGAGLGLSITKALVEMLGGKIWIESEVGKGSIFYFTIEYHPLAGPIISSNNELLIIDEVQLKGNLKILIVEDDEASQFLISIVINEFAKELIVVSSGADAVEACKNNPDIDMVFMDIQMPNMNGYEATRQIRQFNKNVVIIAQTAFALAGDKEKAIEIGCNDYISKPIEKGVLLDIIHRYAKGI